MKGDKNQKQKQKELEIALYKRAVGYDATETIEEYQPDEAGTLCLSKKKITSKHISPDIQTAKLLLDEFKTSNEGRYSKMTLEQLLAEKKRFLAELCKMNGEDD